jgi:hypothetical protein
MLSIELTPRGTDETRMEQNSVRMIIESRIVEIHSLIDGGQ